MPLGNAIILADFFFFSPLLFTGRSPWFFFFSLSLWFALGGRFFFSFLWYSNTLPFPSLPTSLTPNHINFVHVHFTLFCCFSFCVSLGVFFSFRVFQKFHSHGVHPRFKVCSLFPFVSYGPSSSHRSRNPCKDRSLLYSYIDVSNYTIPHLPLCFFSLLYPRSDTFNNPQEALFLLSAGE